MGTSFLSSEHSFSVFSRALFRVNSPVPGTYDPGKHHHVHISLLGSFLLSHKVCALLHLLVEVVCAPWFTLKKADADITAITRQEVYGQLPHRRDSH